MNTIKTFGYGLQVDDNKRAMAFVVVIFILHLVPFPDECKKRDPAFLMGMNDLMPAKIAGAFRIGC